MPRELSAPQPNSKTPRTGVFFYLLYARVHQSDAHGEYADEQLATVQKRIFLIEFLPLQLIIVYQGLVRIPDSWIIKFHKFES